jgi:hypothetical protein
VNPTPTPVVEIGFGATWQSPDADIVWVDVTDRVHWRAAAVQGDRGRHSPVEEISVGNLTLMLWDDDRRFDPFNEASPYAGLLKPGVPIRVRFDIGVVPFFLEPEERITEEDEDRLLEDGEARVLEALPDLDGLGVWRGFVTGWPRRYDMGTSVPVVPLTCYDGIDRLSRSRLPGSVLEVETLASGPIAYWTLTDGVGTEAVELEQAADGSYERDVSGTRGELLPYDTRRCMIGSRPNEETDPAGQRMVRPQAISLTDEVTIRCWFRMTNTSQLTGAATLMLLQRSDEPATLTTSGEPGLGVGIGLGTMVGWVGGQSIGAGGSLFTALEGPAAFAGPDGQHHQLVCTVNAATEELDVWIDGQLLPLLAPPSGVDFAAVLPALRMAAAGWGITNTIAAGNEGNPVVGHFAVWDRALTPEEIEADYLAGVDPWGGDLPGQRINRVLDLVNWPAERRNLAPGYAQLGPAGWERDTAPIEHMRLVENTEAGRLFVDRRGDVALQDWLWPFTEQTTPVLTLGDGPMFMEVEVDYDDDWIRNRVEMSLQGGGTITISDEASIDDYGASVLSRNVIPRTVASGRWLAAWLLALNNQPQPRVPSVDIDLGSLSLEDQITVLTADLGTRVALRLAEPTGDPTDLELIIEGLEHTIRPDNWSVRWFVAPAPAVEPFLPDLDPSVLTVAAGSSDGHVIVEGTTYANARAGTGTADVDDTSGFLIVGQAEDGSDFVVAQTLVRFDLTPWRSIPGDLSLFFDDVELLASRPEIDQTLLLTENGGTLTSLNATYTTARSGSNLSGPGSGITVGQIWNSGPLFAINEAFVEFDLSSLPPLAVDGVELRGQVTSSLVNTAFTIEARARDFGPSLTTADWVAGASLSGLTLLASVAAPGSTGPITFTNEAALMTAINTARAGDGILRMILHSSRTRTNNAPTMGAPFEQVNIAGQGGGADALRLVFDVADSDQAFTVEARLVTWTPPLDDSDFVAGASLSTLPLAASRVVDSDPEWVFASEPGFLEAVQEAVSTDQPLGLLLSSSHQRTNNAPATHDLVALQARELGGAGAVRLRLVPKED